VSGFLIWEWSQSAISITGRFLDRLDVSIILRMRPGKKRMLSGGASQVKIVLC